MRDDEFDTSSYEFASDYVWHLIQKEGRSEEDALMLAANLYRITYQSLKSYWNQQ